MLPVPESKLPVLFCSVLFVTFPTPTLFIFCFHTHLHSIPGFLHARYAQVYSIAQEEKKEKEEEEEEEVEEKEEEEEEGRR